MSGTTLIRLGLVVCLFGLAACGPGRDAIRFDGHVYRTSLKKLDTRDAFRVEARPVSASLAGAREAARYEATIYCVNTYGNSEIIWEVDPDAPEENLSIADDRLTLQGKCPQ